MPELPEVAYFKQYADRTVLHHRIDDVQAGGGPALADLSPWVLRKHLHSHEFTGTWRHGKYLFFHLDNERWLCLHFGMTGDLDYYSDAQSTPPNTRLLVGFENAYNLAYSCRRDMGLISLTDSPEQFAAKRNLGPDALSLTPEEFCALARGHSSTVKSWMTDQSVIAGIGNIYADEIFFHGGIHPGHKVDQLTESQLGGLHQCMNDVLETAIVARADPDRVPGNWLLPFRRKGAFCPNCENALKKTTVAGRITFHCPACQPRPTEKHPAFNRNH